MGICQSCPFTNIESSIFVKVIRKFTDKERLLPLTNKTAFILRTDSPFEISVRHFLENSSDKRLSFVPENLMFTEVF